MLGAGPACYDMPTRRLSWVSGTVGFGPLALGKLTPVLALLVVPGLLVAIITMVIDLWMGRRLRSEFGHRMGIADEAQRWLDRQW